MNCTWTLLAVNPCINALVSGFTMAFLFLHRYRLVSYVEMKKKNGSDFGIKWSMTLKRVTLQTLQLMAIVSACL